MIEFDCADCGRHVIAPGYCQPPLPARCSICSWIQEHLPPEQQGPTREQLGVPLKTPITLPDAEANGAASASNGFDQLAKALAKREAR